MGGNKTRDGLKLSRVVKMISELPGVEVRDGTSHPFVAMAPGQRACPLATSTDVKKMVVPWIEQITDMSRSDIYDSLRAGEWYRN